MINANLDVTYLPDEILLAEHEYIGKSCIFLQQAINEKAKVRYVKNFSFGEKEHVWFFVNKGAFTFKRYKEIYSECCKRTFKVIDYTHLWDVYAGFPGIIFGNNWHSLQDKIYANTNAAKRLLELIEVENPIFHYYNIQITKDEFIKLINNARNNGICA